MRFSIFAILVCLMVSAAGWADTAANTTFVDSNTTRIQGANVQDALESADAALVADDADLTQLGSYHQGVASDADVVHLRSDCVGVSDCFTTTAALTTWLWDSGRSPEPTSGDRVAVHVGPGTFGPLECEGTIAAPKGWVSIKGSGRQTTVFRRSQSEVGLLSACAGAIDIRHCDGLDFDNLAARGDTGVLWAGSGVGNWSDVDMIGQRVNDCSQASLGWYDVPDGASARSLHYIWNGRIEARGTSGLLNYGYSTHFAETWIYGTDIVAKPTTDLSGTDNYALFMTGNADVRLFGGSVRSDVGAAVNSTFPPAFFQGGLVAVENRGGVFHMHGGIIRASASASNVDVDTWGVRASAGGFVHTPATAYTVEPGQSGTASRAAAKGSASVLAPFLNPAGATPPVAVGLNGSDLFVDTDAGAQGGESHLMVSDSSCSSGGPWRDMATGNCR